MATQNPAFGPNAGPNTIAPTIRMAESRKIPTDVVFAATLAFQGVRGHAGHLQPGGPSALRPDRNPDFFAFFVAACAGAAGMLSLTTSKSGALIGVLISVTTIPAAASIGVPAAYGDWEAWRGSAGQLAINVTAILLAGTLTLYVQRPAYQRRRHRHPSDPSRKAAGLPIGHSRRSERERSSLT